MPKTMFLQMYSDGEGGQVGYLDTYEECKAWAYRQAAWLQMNGYGPYSMSCLPGKSIKVQGIGVSAITYMIPTREA